MDMLREGQYMLYVGRRDKYTAFWLGNLK